MAMPTAPPLRVLSPEAGATHLVEVRWGGTRLARHRGRAEDVDRRIGESWEFSTLPGKVTSSHGRPLTDVLGGDLGVLVKLIDTALPLSVQVHPADDPHTGRLGKEEAWIVLDAEPDAALFVGLRDGVDLTTFTAATSAAIADPSRHGDDLVSLLRRVPVQRGTVVLTPARTVHAIGAGILLAEIQQPTDCTHRFWDWGSERPLQTDDALATLDPAAKASLWQPGESPATLEGRHLRLHAGLHTSTTIEPTTFSGPVLVIATEGAVDVCRGATRVHVPRGEPRLVLPDEAPFVVEPHASGQTPARFVVAGLRP